MRQAQESSDALADRLALLKERLTIATTRSAEIDASRRAVAVGAALGETKARRICAALDADKAAAENEIGLLALAIEVTQQEQADAEKLQQEMRSAEAAKRRKAIIDLREAEQRENYQRISSTGMRPCLIQLGWEFTKTRSGSSKKSFG